MESNLNKKTKTMVDPPNGYKYGFPKKLPEGVTDLKNWLIQQGYPEKETEFAMKHMRMWKEEDNTVHIEKNKEARKHKQKSRRAHLRQLQYRYETLQKEFEQLRRYKYSNDVEYLKVSEKNYKYFQVLKCLFNDMKRTIDIENLDFSKFHEDTGLSTVISASSLDKLSKAVKEINND